MSFRTIIAAVCLFAVASLVSAEIIPFYIATSTGTNSPSQGIYRSTLDTTTGTLSNPVLAVKSGSVAFIAINPSGSNLYTVSSPAAQPAAPATGAQPAAPTASKQPAATGAARQAEPAAGGQPAAAGTTAPAPPAQPGVVSAYTIDKSTGNLTLINEVSSGGANPNHLSVDQTGKILLNSNYGSGSVQTVAIQANGGLGKQISFFQHTGSSVEPTRQTGPHAHCIYASPDNKYVYCSDLGLDKIMMYKMSSSGKLTANKPAFVQTKPGTGPRHIMFHPSGKFLYVISELVGTITGYSYNAKTGALTEIQTISTFPSTFTGAISSAELAITPNGKFLYGSNRGNNSVAAYTVNQTTGKLTLVEYESSQMGSPGHITIDPSGNFLLAANRSSNSISCYRINQDTGALNISGPIILVAAPACTVFVK